LVVVYVGAVDEVAKTGDLESGTGKSKIYFKIAFLVPDPRSLLLPLYPRPQQKNMGTKAHEKRKAIYPAARYTAFYYLLIPSFSIIDLYRSTSFFFR